MDYDRILIEDILKGDIDSFEKLINKYQRVVYGYLLKMTFSREEAEDITQEVFIKVYNNLYKYNGSSRLITWILKIAVNEFKTQYKKRKRANYTNHEELFKDIPCDISDLPEVALEMKESGSELMMVLESISLEQKNALILRYIQGFSFKEVGEIMGISTEAAKMRVQRAKENLVKKNPRFSPRGGFAYEV